MAITIYHNPKCSKSRQTLQILRDNGIEPEIIEYLKHPPSPSELRDILVRLEMKPLDVTRREESIFEKLQTTPEKLDDDALVNFLCEHPEALQRPIVIRGQRAVIGRPPENVLDIL